MTGVAFGYAPAIASGVVDRRPTRRPTRTSPSTRCRGSPSPGHVPASEDGSPIEGATVRALGTPVPPATTDAAGAYSPRAADRRLHAPRLGRRLHGAGRGRDQPRRRRTSPRTSSSSASSTTSATAAARSRSTGSTPASQTGAVRRRVRRPAAAAVRLRVLRRDLLAALPVRQRLPELPRPGPVQPLPDRDPLGRDAERGDLPVLAGPRRSTARARSTTRPSGRAPTGRSSSSTPQMQVFGVAGPRLASRSSSGRTAGSTCSTAPTRPTPVTAATPTIGIENADGHRRPPVLVPRGRHRPEQRLPLRARPERLRPRHRDRRQRRRAHRRRARSSPARRADGPRPTPTATTRSASGRARTTLTASATNYVDRVASPATVVDEGDIDARLRLDAAVARGRPDRRSSATVAFGDTTDVDVTLSNSGTAPLDLGGEGARPGRDPARRCRRRPRSSSPQARSGRAPADPGGVPADRHQRHDTGRPGMRS